MIIRRAIEDRICDLLESNKVILILGTRRVGKTFLINRVKERYHGKVLMLNAEDVDVQELLRKRSAVNYQRITGDAGLLIIDEAQAIPDIGMVLKLMIDTQPNLTILATGSSSFDLVNTTGEPLTGRQYPFILYPVAQMELNQDAVTTRSQLEERLVLGSYPEVFQLQSVKQKESYLKELAKSYLLKDILAYADIKHSAKLVDLLRLIAFQVGSEVSYHELSLKLGINKITVEHYLDLLQKVFVLFRLPSYSTNQRKEIAKGSKWYFYDNGIRNAVIQDFRAVPLRNDMGMLWENYIISERLKRNEYVGEDRQLYFWRNYDQQEVDLVESFAGQLSAVEIKYSESRKKTKPKAFDKAYPDASFNTVDRDNYSDFICSSSNRSDAT
jgi:predicted AAA+ superfamily ATPase